MHNGGVLDQLTGLFYSTFALVPWVVRDETPKPADVKAGWGAFGLFMLLVLAVVLLCISMTRRLRNTREARDAGVYGDPPKVEQRTDADA